MSASMPRLETPSVLEEFSSAKKKIQEVFELIDGQIEAVQTFIETVMRTDTDHVMEKDTMDRLNDLVVKVKGINEILSRDQMKVAFFGRTSNGKSTCINAMLWDKVLPSGIGHTTSCFLSVEGSSKPSPFILTEDDEEQEVQKVQKLAHALSQTAEKLSEDSLIRIFWPHNKCRLLAAEVQIVDSPGVDMTPDLDLWIDKYCLNADVFILVANAESTLMQAEKNFFHKVSSALSKPNIFILHNRWDASASEPDFMDEVREQHEERAVSFLVNELGIYSKSEAQDRVFFISAKEMLNTRINRTKGVAENPANYPDGYKARQLEFEDFERKFEECISRSAIRTKFDQHVSNGKEIVKGLSSTLARLHENATHIRNVSHDESDTHKMRRNFNREQMEKITKRVHDQINQIKENVSLQVSSALEAELNRIEILIDKFEFTDFHPSKYVIDAYRKKLIEYVEDGVRQNLVSLCSSSLVEEVKRAKEEMIEGLTNVIKDRSTSEVSRDFVLDYEINFFALNDFEEDLTFRFSASPANLVRKLPYGKLVSTYSMLTAIENFSRVASSRVPLAIEGVTGGSIRATDVETISRFLPSGLAAASCYKAFQWSGFSDWGTKLVMGAAVGYLGVYAWERLRWTKFRQEQAFREQFARHASNKLRHSVEYTSSKCSTQVENELKDTFARLEFTAKEVTDDIDDKIQLLDEKSQQYCGIAEMSKKWKNKFDWLTHELRNYRKDYIPKTGNRRNSYGQNDVFQNDPSLHSNPTF